jgi:6-phosphogluconolactonase
MMLDAISRRHFVKGATLATLASHPLSQALAAQLGKRHLLLVGTSSGRNGSGGKGVYKVAFDSSNGSLEVLDVTECNSPQFMALSPDEKFLFTLNSGFRPAGEPEPPPPPPPQPGQPRRRGGGGGMGGGGAVSSWTFDRKTGAMSLVNEVSCGKAGSGVYLCCDHTGSSVYIADYGGGSIGTFRVEPGGKLSELVEFYKYPPLPDGTTSKAHRVTVSPGNGWLLVNDLGLSCIHVYKMDPKTAKLTPADPPQWEAEPGSGCRGLRFHPNGKIAYVVDELKPTLYVLSWDEKAGKLTTLQGPVADVPPGYTGGQGMRCNADGCAPDAKGPHGATSAPGDIVFDKKWEHAYVTSRLDDFIATFKVEKDFKLTWIENTTSGGVRERDLALDPTDNWLIVANPDSNTVDVMKRDPRTGRLANTATTHLKLPQAQCVIFPERPNVTL